MNGTPVHTQGQCDIVSPPSTLCLGGGRTQRNPHRPGQNVQKSVTVTWTEEPGAVRLHHPVAHTFLYIAIFSKKEKQIS